jgi:hypothetical protein
MVLSIFKLLSNLPVIFLKAGTGTEIANTCYGYGFIRPLGLQIFF